MALSFAGNECAHQGPWKLWGSDAHQSGGADILKWGQGPMASEDRAIIIKLFLQDLKILLTEASGLASIGTSLSEAGATEEALQKIFDMEPLLHDARTLLNAVVLQHRRETER